MAGDREVLGAVRALCETPAPLTAEMHDSALRIAERSGYNIYDALILAAALEMGCNLLYSGDMRDGQTIGAITIRNPFIPNCSHP